MFKQLEDKTIRCIRCGECRGVCPVFTETGIESGVARGKLALLEAVSDDKISIEEGVVDKLYQCLLCNGCFAGCPSGIDTEDILEEARAKVVDRLGGVPESQKNLRDNVYLRGNSFGEKQEERGSWLPKEHSEKKTSKNLYFAGCSVSYSQNRIGRSLIKVLESIGYDFTTLGNDEICCGDPLFRLGDAKAGQEIIDKNTMNFEELGVENIITTCAGCVKSLNHRYDEKFNVMHGLQLLDKLIAEGQFKIEKPLSKKVIYFDGCDLGRHSQIFEEPRNILKAIPGVELVEFAANRNSGKCCGGPLMASDPEMAKSIASKRVQEAIDKGVDMIATACPTCMVNLKEGAKYLGVNIDIQDIPMILPRLL